MANSVVSNRGMTASFKNYQFLITSSTKSTPEIVHFRPLRRTTGKKLTLRVKKQKLYVTSCTNNPTPKPGDFPMKNWFFQKKAEIVFELAKRLIVWILTGVYKDHEFKKNLPFNTGDLVEVKATGEPIFGVVQEIGEKKTCIKGVDGFPGFLPNADLETKIVKNLSFLTVDSGCDLDCCAAKNGNAEHMVPIVKMLWGISFSFESSYESLKDIDTMIKDVDKMIEDLSTIITQDSNVIQHDRVMVSVDSYRSQEKKIKILVSCFVDAKKSLKEYTRIKHHLQMKLEDKLNNYDKKTDKETEKGK